MRVHKQIQMFLWLLCITTPGTGTSLGPGNSLTLEGQADLPRRCCGSAAVTGLGEPFGQVKWYRCMCLGSEEHCCEFLALVRDQKLCRHKKLKRYQCCAAPDTKCSKDGGENMRSKPLTVAGGSVTFLWTLEN